MLVNVNSVGLWGVDAVGVSVEVNIAGRGFPGFDIVGLAAKSVVESRERVRTAIVNSGIEFPSNKKITVNLAPADFPKEGTLYDLPIAVGIMCYVSNINIPTDTVFLGELSLDGKLRHTKGGLLAAIFAKDISVIAPPDLNSVLKCLRDPLILKKFVGTSASTSTVNIGSTSISDAPPHPKFSDVLGQEQAKRALVIAAAGGHNVILTGPPGSGKSMLSKAFSSILPKMCPEEFLEVTKIYSSAGYLMGNDTFLTKRPFRAPHHTISYVSMVGGGLVPRPGEISLAHRGVLFLDEFPEFPRPIIETLRQPLEEGSICINRNGRSAVFPARFTLLAACNPCPCGYLNHPARPCVCTKHSIERYKNRISGPVLDRIDLHVSIKPVDVDNLTLKNTTFLTRYVDNSLTTADSIGNAVSVQRKRMNTCGIYSNSELTNKMLSEFCTLDPESEKIMKVAAVKFNLSARSYFRTIKISRTIADLALSEDIRAEHVMEALQYRCG